MKAERQRQLDDARDAVERLVDHRLPIPPKSPDVSRGWQRTFFCREA